MEEVIAMIGLKNNGNVLISSNNAVYDKINHNTMFYKNVKIEYLDKNIQAQNFDILFTENISKIYNNVVAESKELNIYSDFILINMLSGDINFHMADDKNKVRLIKRNEFIN